MIPPLQFSFYTNKEKSTMYSLKQSIHRIYYIHCLFCKRYSNFKQSHNLQAITELYNEFHELKKKLLKSTVVKKNKKKWLTNEILFPSKSNRNRIR